MLHEDAFWSFRYSEIFACCLSVYLISCCNSVSSQLSSFISRIICSYQKDGDQLQSMWNTVCSEKKELVNLSATDEFAAYSRKKRRVDKLEADYNALVASMQKSALIGSVSLRFTTVCVCYLVALFAMYYSRRLVIAHVDAVHFWPLGALLTFPCPEDSSTGSKSMEKSPISLFMFLIVLSHVLCTARQVLCCSKRVASTEMQEDS
ncbi:hypothetical protein AB6A40_003663 [Gnathostoma spinigerum]|uniref:Guided entry of tail-anchored proteins factor 1 n=1 Tax=Gnathostoma spinigerum TaxID=75299 RepID=A0ABD6EHY2_9BILA